MLIRVGKIGSAHREKEILSEIESVRFAISLYKTFKDDEYLYFVFEYCPYGTLEDLASGYYNNKLPLRITAYYAAQLVLFLEDLHA